MSYSVAKNTSFLTTASVLQKVISFVYFALIARLIEVEGTGQYFFALTFAAIFIVVADFGLSPVLNREVSRESEKINEYGSAVFWTKLFFGFFSYGLLVLFANILNYDPSFKVLIYLAGLMVVFDNIHSVFYSLFRARKNLLYESIGIICSQSVTLIIGTTALLLGWPLYWLVLAYVIASFLMVFYSGVLVFKKLRFELKFVLDKKIFRTFLIMSWPFALAGIVGKFYSYADSLLMSKLLTAKELGWWGVPYKLVFAFQFIPISLSAGVYPVFSELFKKEKERLPSLFIKSYRYLFFVTFPIAAGSIALAKPIILWIYGGRFLPSVFPFQLLMGGFAFYSLAYITGAYLNASDRQKTQTFLVTAVLLISIILNLILLPRVGLTGAGITALVTNFILFIIGFTVINRSLRIRKQMTGAFFKSLWPAALMGLCVYILSRQMNFLVTIPIGMALYFGLSFLSGSIDKGLLIRVKSKVLWKNEKF